MCISCFYSSLLEWPEANWLPVVMSESLMGVTRRIDRKSTNECVSPCRAHRPAESQHRANTEPTQSQHTPSRRVVSPQVNYGILFIFTLNFSLFSWQFVFSQCTTSCLHCLMCVVSSYAARTRCFTSSKCQLHPEGSEYCENICLHILSVLSNIIKESFYVEYD